LSAGNWVRFVIFLSVGGGPVAQIRAAERIPEDWPGDDVTMIFQYFSFCLRNSPHLRVAGALGEVARDGDLQILIQLRDFVRPPVSIVAFRI
jgi:hypothetical protein